MRNEKCAEAGEEHLIIKIEDATHLSDGLLVVRTCAPDIACSSLSRSEIVVPLFSKEGEVTAVLDIDSKELATFDETDRRHLETICRLFESLLGC